MKVNVNNKEVECAATNLSELISELGVPCKGIAVAVNNRMVPSTLWEKHELHENDMILIIKAVCGG